MDRATAVSYASTFGAGYFSGICGELVSLYQNNNLTAKGVTNPAFRDLCAISGVQQCAKQYSKEVLAKIPTFKTLSIENPFLFGAATGLPMWAITRLFGTPLQNSRKQDKKPFDGLAKSIRDDFFYHTVKNGLDQYCASVIFPAVLPKIDTVIGKKVCEGTVAALVGSGTYLITWPVKTKLTGQTLPAAVKICNKSFPKVFVKKITYGIAKPRILKLLQ